MSIKHIMGELISYSISIIIASSLFIGPMLAFGVRDPMSFLGVFLFMSALIIINEANKK